MSADSGMSADSDKLRELLARLGFSQRQGAEALQIANRRFRRMCAGGTPVPRSIMIALETLAREKGAA